ncbi:MAG: AzlC family ABC transporter permease [Spirochaetaceae bacterium]|jgi:4-azaleucine resistance transporter AzlC|nr:AzlC family ABC transporter permease [Spirochaetaceae bacterium]
MLKAFRYSIPVLLGYLAIGAAFGLMMAEAGYPWYLTGLMSLLMYAGAGQYAAVGIFAAGLGIAEACILQLVINMRHIAYSLTMLKRYNSVGRLGGKWRFAKWYLVFATSDETFALLSSIPPQEAAGEKGAAFMLKVAIFDQSYWILGGLIGFFAGSLIPFDFTGVDFALTALFIVLLIDQMYRVRRAGPFLLSAVLSILAVIVLPERLSLLLALVISLALTSLIPERKEKEALSL